MEDLYPIAEEGPKCRGRQSIKLRRRFEPQGDGLNAQYFSLPVRIVTRVSPNGPEYFMYRRHGAKINGVFRDIANNRAALKPKHDRKISPRTKFF
ncbi:unnamed protein product [Bathycoccus prasinos]